MAFILDLADAYLSVPLAAEERRFSCAQVSSGVIVWRCLGFGGREYPLVFCRVVSLLTRLSQGIVQGVGELNTYMDDPAAVLKGSECDAVLNAELLILFWLCLGVPLAWHKGVLTAGPHLWVGVWYSTEGKDVVLELPLDFLKLLASDLEQLSAPRGVATVTLARRAVGRASRVAQIVPEARPFSSALWAALTDAMAAGRREAPPNCVARARFHQAAQWFLALLGDCIFPLRRRISPDYPHGTDD
eukprot:3886184-Amphidinium_carterae.1